MMFVPRVLLFLSLLATTTLAETHRPVLIRGQLKNNAASLEETHQRRLRHHHHHHHQPTEAEIEAADKKEMEEEAEETAKEKETEEEAVVMEESSSSSSSSSSEEEEEPVVAEAAAVEPEDTVVTAAAVQEESPLEAILDGSDPNEKYWIAGAGICGVALVIVGLVTARKDRKQRKRPINVETLNLHHPRDPEIEMVMNSTGLSQKVLGGGASRRNSTPSFGKGDDGNEPIWSIRHSMTSVTGTTGGTTSEEVQEAMKNVRPNKKNSPPASAFQQHKNKF